MVSEPLALAECVILPMVSAELVGQEQAGGLVLWTSLAGAEAHVPQSTGHGYGSVNISPGHQRFRELMWLGLHVKGRLRQQRFRGPAVNTMLGLSSWDITCLGHTLQAALVSVCPALG